MWSHWTPQGTSSNQCILRIWALFIWNDLYSFLARLLSYVLSIFSWLKNLDEDLMIKREMDCVCDKNTSFSGFSKSVSLVHFLLFLGTRSYKWASRVISLVWHFINPRKFKFCAPVTWTFWRKPVGNFHFWLKSTRSTSTKTNTEK